MELHNRENKEHRRAIYFEHYHRRIKHIGKQPLQIGIKLFHLSFITSQNRLAAGYAYVEKHNILFNMLQLK